MEAKDYIDDDEPYNYDTVDKEELTSEDDNYDTVDEEELTSEDEASEDDMEQIKKGLYCCHIGRKRRDSYRQRSYGQSGSWLAKVRLYKSYIRCARGGRTCERGHYLQQKYDANQCRIDEEHCNK